MTGRSETLRGQHEAIFTKAMESTNVHAILGVAEVLREDDGHGQS